MTVARCPVCGGARDVSFSARILHKYDVAYLYCSDCGFLQTERPYWLEEAYGSAIAGSDMGLLQRNIDLAGKLAGVLYFQGNRHGRYLDTAGGYGVLTRLMRDYGFDFYWEDKYCANIFAQGFEADKAQPPFDAVTAFEVLEHIYEPLEYVGNVIARAQANTLIFSTVLFTGAPPPVDWWYYSPHSGQHISFYQRRTLKTIGDRLGLCLYSNGWFHILTKRRFNPILFRTLSSHLSLLTSILVRVLMPSRKTADADRSVVQSAGDELRCKR